MLILTNFKRFPEKWRSSQGMRGEAMLVETAWDVLKLSRRADLIIINCSVKLTYQLAIIYFLLPFLRRPVLSHDIVLRRPLTAQSRMAARFKKALLSRIDHFSLYFRILDGYHESYGIGPDRTSYLPFKPNLRYKHEYQVGPDGEYILCFGRSERDYDTFFAAMEQLPDLPAAIPPPNFAQLAEHASRFTRPLSALPANVRILEDDGTSESLMRILGKAHLVVLPIVKSRIGASGIGTYLNAMLMGKCVILSEGPAASDVLTDQALMVPAEDAHALAKMIRRAWNDDDLRHRTAAAGQRYAESCGGEPELRQRVLDRAIEKLVK
ncbi:MAG: glycosyltransferase [Acidobacteriota bacterium]|nr:glycosyltransferase [Acidobacteriota bacterium]